ncbi:MAG: prolyl oligopeptidase family serine peptidase [Pseudomonadota bacterium]|nr:prolyl oligopeptidase family serine peptidase [Pseudomonadota bacterium]
MKGSIESAAKKALSSLTQRREVKTWQNRYYWIEQSPEIKGEYLVELTEGGEKNILISGDFAPGNSVHEYGGGDYCIAAEGDIYFVCQKDQQIYLFNRLTKQIQKVSKGKKTSRYADIDVSNQVLLAVREDHSNDLTQNMIIAIDLNNGTEKIVAEGHDFYGSPRFNENGHMWAYIYWDHPHMPWDQCKLCYGYWSDEAHMITINQSDEDVISQFCWTSDNKLLYTSDFTGWANLYLDGKPVCLTQQHFGFERWQQGQQNIGMTESGTIVAIAGPPEARVLGRIVGRNWVPFDLPCCDFAPFIATQKENVIVIGAYHDCPPKILKINTNTGNCEIIQDNCMDYDHKAVVKAKAIVFPTLDGQESYAFFYESHNYLQASKKSPLLVLCHGGPTSATSPQWDPMIQFWLQQGISVVDVNYRGSTGYGRKYQDALKYQWGVLDVEDAIAARDFLVKEGLVDPKRCFIRGKSSGGLTTLRALMWQDKFAAGGCYYGVSDLTQLLKITHKFEQHYLDYLIGPYPEEKKRYDERSPSNHIKKITAPIIFFHGLLDKVVPPSQTTVMVEALQKLNIPCEYHTFETEKHGFKESEHKITALIKECQFYLSK